MRSPATAESVVEAVSDSINFSARAAGSGFSDQTKPTGVTRAMNVKKRYAVSFAEAFAFDVKQLSAKLLQPSYGDVSRNQGIRNTGKAPVLQMDIGSANFGKFHLKQRRIDFEIGLRNFTHFDRSVWFGDYGNEWHVRRIGHGFPRINSDP
jgi:hypothetical protein